MVCRNFILPEPANYVSLFIPFSICATYCTLPSLCWRYLSSWAGKGLSCRQAGPEVVCPICKKNSACQWQAEFSCWRYLSSRAVTRKVLSAKVSLTSVFGMGTGGPSPQSTPTSSEKTPCCSLRLFAKAHHTPFPLPLRSEPASLGFGSVFEDTMYPEN